MRKILSLLAFLLAGASTFAQDWTAPVLDGSKEYRYSTAVNARLSTNLFPSSPNLVLGAFVNGECKGMASPDPTLSGDPFYMLDLRSDAEADLNMPITFRVYDQGTGYEYVLNSPSSIKFIDEATYGNPPSTNAVQLSLTAATSFSLNFTEAELWTPEKPIEYNLKEYMTITPTGAQLPVNLTWEITPEGYAHATDTLLVALTLYDGPLTLNLKAPSLPTGGPGATLASSVFHIVQHATAIDLVQTTLTINKNDMESMMAFMQKDVAYKLNPTTSTDEVLWETENSDILRWDDTRKAFYPQAGGTTRMRPYVLQNGGTKKLVPLAGGNDAWITVTVNVPVESITIDYSAFNGSFKANVGDEHLALAGGGAVSDGHCFHLIILHHADDGHCGLGIVAFRRMRIDDVVVQEIALGVETGYLAAVTETGVDRHRPLLPYGRRKKELLEILPENIHRLHVGLLLCLTDYFI